MEIKPNYRIFITGKTQSGKTYFTKFLLRQYQSYFIYDFKREYGELGFICKNLESVKNGLKNGVIRFIYQPNDLSQDHFNFICGFLFENLRNICFCVDEVHNFSQKMLIPENFKKIITIGQGNPYNIGVICITQRPQNTHNDIISNSSLIVCFKLNLERDAKIIYEMTGIPIESIQNLQYNHFFIYNDRDEISISKHNPI